MTPVRIGILSDTHIAEPNKYFRALVDACFSKVSMIIHAGDLTDIRVLQAFDGKEIHAVHGNMCRQSSYSALPQKKVIRVGNFNIGIIHSVGLSYDFEDLLLNEFDEVDCIVYGHTHMPTCHQAGSVLYINPGSYGSRGTFAILEVGKKLTGTLYQVPQLGTKLHSK